MHRFVHQQEIGETGGQAQDLESIEFLKLAAVRVVTYLLGLPTAPWQSTMPALLFGNICFPLLKGCFAVFPCWNILRRWWGSRWEGMRCPGRVWWTQKHKTVLNNAGDEWFCIRALLWQGKQFLRMLLWKYVREQACLILFHPLHVTLEKQDKLHFFYAKSLGFFIFSYIYLLKNASLIGSTHDTSTSSYSSEASLPPHKATAADSQPGLIRATQNRIFIRQMRNLTASPSHIRWETEGEGGRVLRERHYNQGLRSSLSVPPLLQFSKEFASGSFKWWCLNSVIIFQELFLKGYFR